MVRAILKTPSPGISRTNKRDACKKMDPPATAGAPPPAPPPPTIGVLKWTETDFFAVLQRDASDSLAAIELVLAQPAIGSPLIDNLNASIHLRAPLTDLFLLTEIAKIQYTAAKPMASNG